MAAGPEMTLLFLKSTTTYSEPRVRIAPTVPSIPTPLPLLTTASITPSIQLGVVGQPCKVVSLARWAGALTGRNQPPLNRYSVPSRLAAPVTPSLNESGSRGHVAPMAAGSPA